MNNTWLILDAPYLSWRAFHSTGFLSHKEIPTGIAYGYLKALSDLQALFMTEKVVHCFDKARSIRKEVYPEYKANRIKDGIDEQLKLAMFEVKNQISLIRKEYLPEIGCQNIFYQKNYEADDVIASVCKNLPTGDNAVIVSSDKDLYQLLNNRISMYDPRQKKTITDKSFEKEWKIPPTQWAYAKAIAGCGTDNIKGIDGVGEKTAIKFLLGEIKEDSKLYKKIVEGESIWKRNLPLVKLPYEGTKEFIPVEDKISRTGWEKLTKRLGMNSIGNYKRLLPFDNKEKN